MSQERRLIPVTDNSIQDVINTIDSYQYGPIRALAQDPPQNSFDARFEGQLVRVEYRLLSRENEAGQNINLLTITDTGTTGLDGPILGQSDLDQRTQTEGGLVIKQGENWAAFEAMRYTKSGEDKLGSRGQGKYAYLFHSAHQPPGATSELPIHSQWMVILYDTLLTNGEYRFGGRFHNPSAQRIEPPFIGAEARQMVADAYRGSSFNIPLGLEPLSEPGTRIIIPYLSEEARESINSGELVNLLESLWWRKIQKRELSISVVDQTGLAHQVGVPRYWQSESWKTNESQEYYVQESITLHSDSAADRKIIKRVVFVVDDASDINDENDGLPQRNGVQLLRGGQWIETLPADIFADYIPFDYRTGFRGFVEFDRQLERRLREIENPAHDGFNRRMGIYRDIVAVIKNCVNKFALANGWIENQETIVDPRHDDLVREFTKLFVDVQPDGPAPSPIKWHCDVHVTYPSDTAFVDWGDDISVEAICYRDPSVDGQMVTFNAKLVRPDGSKVEIFNSRSQKLRSSRSEERTTASVSFGELKIKHPGEPGSKFISPGRYSVEVDCTAEEQLMVTGKSYFYVAQTPPKPSRDVTLELIVCNPEDGGNVIPHGGRLRWKAVVRNYQSSTIDGLLVVSIEDEPVVLCQKSFELPGSVLGDQPTCCLEEGLRTVQPAGYVGTDVLELSEGRYKILASVTKDDDTIAAAHRIIYVGAPPPDDEPTGNLPFRLVADESGKVNARWLLDDPVTDHMYTLRWSSSNPIYQALARSTRPKGSIRLPREEYLSEIIAEGLVDWAMREYQRQGDEGRLRLIVSGAWSSGSELGRRFEQLVEKLKSEADHPILFSETQRELAAIMVEVARKVR